MTDLSATIKSETVEMQDQSRGAMPAVDSSSA